MEKYICIPGMKNVILFIYYWIQLAFVFMREIGL